MLIRCPECAREVSDAAPSCPGCGYVPARKTGVAAPPTFLSTDQQILIEQRVANEGPSVGVAYVLWFFLWWVSGHRFYLGKPGTALLQILSYFVPDRFPLGDHRRIPRVPEMIRAKRSRLRTLLVAQMGGLPPVQVNPYKNLPSYYDPNA